MKRIDLSELHLDEVWMSVRRTVLYGLYLLAFLVLQNVIFSHIAPLGVRAMFLPALVVAVAMFEGGPTAFDRLEKLRHRQRRVMVHDWCEGCGKCAARCRQKAIEVVNGRAVVDQEKCVYCGYCARACPQFCIKVV